MSTQNLLIIGQGDIGLLVTNKLAQDSLNVTGLARRERHHYDLHPKAKFLQADALTLSAEQLQDFLLLLFLYSDSEASDHLSSLE